MAHSVVCVIGAGPCGLTTVKNLVQAGVTDIICHEAQREPGGLWAYSADPQRASVYDAAHTISSKHLSQFRDFPMPEAYPDFPSHRQVLAYMRAYADRFGLDRHIRFGSRVTRARRGVDGGWVIEGANEAGPFRDTADHLIVCAGHHRAAALPQNTEGFNGHRIHSAAFRTTDAYRGKRVLVVGGGNSACDIAAANGACKNSGSWAAAPSPRGAASAPPGISADSRDARNAAMPALPSTDPTCRVVL